MDEQSHLPTFMSTVLTVVIAVIVVAAVFVPLIDDFKKTAGDEVTYTNDTAAVLRPVENGDMLTVTRTVLSESSWSDLWTLNGIEISNPLGAGVEWDVGIMSDAFYVVIYSDTNPSIAGWYDMSDAVPVGHYLNAGTTPVGGTRTISFYWNEGTMQIIRGSETLAESPYTWGYTVCPYADGKYCAAVQNGTGYVSNAKDVVLCGAYESGDLDTMYYYYNGASWVSNPIYSMNTDINLNLVSGTTDVYITNVAVSISSSGGSETFTPYRVLLPLDVVGHKDSGILYTLYGILPVFMLLGVLLVIVNLFTGQRGSRESYSSGDDYDNF